MGIFDCLPLCSPLINQAARDTPNRLYYYDNEPCNVYIDGLAVWFLGFTNNAPNSINATVKLYEILDHIERENHFYIKSIIMYFTGQYPAVKGKPISDNVKSRQVQNWCFGLYDNGIINGYNFLDVGEAEFECFFGRDRNFASIIVTTDSNILPICYKYNRKSPYDNVFCYLAHQEVYYDPALLTTTLNRNAFILLLLLRGSDNYIESVFTSTMVKLIIDLLQRNDPFYNKHFQRINSIIRELTEANIEMCIVYFIWIIVIAKHHSIGRFAWPTYEAYLDTANYFQVMEWLILYLKSGKNVQYYNWDFKVLGCGALKFHFISDMCDRVFPYKGFNNVNRFKDIENIMIQINII